METHVKIETISTDTNGNGYTYDTKPRGSVMEEFKKHKTNIIEIMQGSNATPIRHDHGGAGYACCFCDQQYLVALDLKAHTIENHQDLSNASFFKKKSMHGYCVKLDITSLSCKECGGEFDALENFMNHLKNAHMKNIDTVIKNYIIPFKFGSDRLKCCVCPNYFGRFKHLQEHMNTHYRNYICHVCDAGFVNQGGLTRHARGHRTGIFKCDFCPKIFDTDRKRLVHEKMVHVKVKLNRCGFCNEKFESIQRKQKHLKEIHQVKLLPFICQACERKFTTHVALTRHIRKYHLLERKHKCSSCEMTFFSAADLDNHLVKHTKIRKFQCGVCLKAFLLKKALREHMRIHNDDKRFKCEHCGQAFVQKCSWRGHMRSKHGEDV